MPTWLIIILIAALIGGVVGFFNSSDDDRGGGIFSGAMMGAMGCGTILLQFFIWGAILGLLIWLFGLIFG